MTKSQGCAEEDKARESSWSNEVCPELLRGNMADTARRLTSCYTMFGKLRGGQNCERRNLLLRYSRKVVCANTTTGEE